MEEEASPTSISEDPWIFETVNEIRSRYPVPREESGKWMLFYDRDCVDAAWEKAKGLYRNGQLVGISSMKVSTAYINPRASNTNSNVIIFFCGPSGNRDMIMQYGKNLLEKMGYKRQVSSGRYPPFICYKTAQMTAAGTAATGQARNHLYKLRFE